MFSIMNSHLLLHLHVYDKFCQFQMVSHKERLSFAQDYKKKTLEGFVADEGK